MVETAVILAGGFGTRLQSLVKDVPKPMALVNGIPFLTYQMKCMKHYGIRNIVLSVGYLSEVITDYYSSSFEGLSITYAKETTPLGTGGGIRLALEKCNVAEALVLNGDSFFDIDLGLFYQLHQQHKSVCSLALRKVQNAARYGAITLSSDNRISGFKEKSGLQEEGLINGGIYILNKNIYFENTPETSAFSFEKDFIEKKTDLLQISGFEFDDYFIDIGLPEDYQKAQHDFKRFKYQ
jgi:D-glycero-alpha-D-manno-heptose 1-phosphate guanylyltransferase